MGAAAAARWEGGRTQRQCAVGGRTRTVQLRERKAKRGRRLLIEAVVLTEAVVGFAVRRRMVESASTVVLAEREKTQPTQASCHVTSTSLALCGARLAPPQLQVVLHPVEAL